MNHSNAETKLRQQIIDLLPKLEVKNGEYDMVFSDGYMMIWKYIRDYAKELGLDPSKIRKAGHQDPIFVFMNDYMYPLGKSQPSIEATADKILDAARDYLNNIR